VGTLRNHRPGERAGEFFCRACGSAAVVYPAHLSDDAPVKCQRCRTVLCTLREFRRSAERGTARMQMRADAAERIHLRTGWPLVDRLFQRLASP
jgi:hypothetical protein